jgi:hypothetical protein
MQLFEDVAHDSVLHSNTMTNLGPVAALQAAASDAAGAMQLFEDVAHGDIEQGSIYELSEANLVKVGAIKQVGAAMRHVTAFIARPVLHYVCRGLHGACLTQKLCSSTAGELLEQAACNIPRAEQ